MGAIDYGIIVIFLLAMVWVGWKTGGKNETMDDFVLGGRSFGKLALTGTVSATMLGSGLVLGATGSVYSSGISGTMLSVYFGTAVGLILTGLVLGKPIRKMGARSLAETISFAFGKNARLTSAIIVVAYAVCIIATCIVGLRTVMSYVLGDFLDVSLPMMTVLAAATAIAYTALGGLSAVVWTDTVQLFIILIGVFVIGPIVGITQTGGVDVITEAYAAEGMSLTNPFGAGGFSFQGFILGSVTYILATPADPTMPQRVLSAKDNSTARFAFVASGVGAPLIVIALLIIGGSAHVLMPGIEATDGVLPLFIIEHYPPILKGIALSGVIAAIMSTFTSFLVLATTHSVYDIGTTLKPDLSEKAVTKTLPYTTIIFGVIGIIIALFIESLLAYLSMVFSIIGAAFIPALLAALFFRHKTSKMAASASVLVGAVVAGVLFLTHGYDIFLGDPVFIGLFSSTGVIVLGSLVLKDKSKKEDETVA